MIRLIQFWNVFYIDEFRNSQKVTFQTWLDETNGKKEYCLFKPPNYKKTIVSKEKGNKYFKYLCKKYKPRIIKIF